MRHLGSAILAIGLVLPGSGQAQDIRGELEDFGKGAGKLIERLLKELTPEFERLKDEIEALDRYDPPEILPNGDIIIRRKRAPEGETPRREPKGRTSQDEAIET